MTAKQKQALLDISAFCKYAIKKKLKFNEALFTITHDTVGLSKSEDKWFLPRTNGYAKRKNI